MGSTAHSLSGGARTLEDDRAPRAPSAPSARRHPPTVLHLMVGLSAFGIVITAVVLTGVIVSVTRLRHATDEMDQNATALGVTREIEVRARDYQRLSNMYVATHDSDVADARAENRRAIEALLFRAHGLAVTDAERTLVRRASDALDAYFGVREDAERAARRPSDVIPITRAAFDRALASLESLERANTARVSRTFDEAHMMATLAAGVASTGGGAIVLALVLAALAAHRSFSRPLITLASVISQYRAGDTGVRAPTSGPRELAEVSSVFNGMADSLAAQRTDELVYLAAVVHDLRNPLNGIKLGLHSLRTEQAAVDRARVLDLVDRQVDRLSRIVGDVLDATKIEAGQLELRKEIADVRHAVREIVSLFAPTSPIHRIALDVGSEPAIASVDPARIEQVVSNLLSNAIKYSPRGGAIDVRVRALPSEVVIEVADCGIGIAQQAIPDLFAPFHRAAPDVVAGSGLGLSIVRRIVHAHGGVIEVESALGRGSTFRVRLPRSRGAV